MCISRMVQARGNVREADINENAENFPVTLDVGSNLAQVSQNTLNSAIQSLCDDFIFECILDVVFDVHRACKTGMLSIEKGCDEGEEQFTEVSIEGLDIFGQPPVKKQHECVCPNCSRNLAAARFAPHLEKCMGMGRNSSRIASRRIQNSSREANNHLGQVSDDDDEDDDWVERKKRKRDKNSPRRTRAVKLKLDHSSGNSSNGSSLSSLSNGSNISNSSIESLLLSSGINDKRVILGQMCGVVSEHTGKMCTRSMRCPQHSNDQRRSVRDHFLSGLNERISRTNDSTVGTAKFIVDSEEPQLENDGFEPSSWDHDLSNTTSPADSTSTNNSSSTVVSSSSSHTKKSSSNSSTKSKKKTNKSIRDVIPE